MHFAALSELPTQVLSPEMLPEDIVLGDGEVCGCSLGWSGCVRTKLLQTCRSGLESLQSSALLLLGLPTLTVMAALGAQVPQAGAACCEL